MIVIDNFDLFEQVLFKICIYGLPLKGSRVITAKNLLIINENYNLIYNWILFFFKKRKIIKFETKKRSKYPHRISVFSKCVDDILKFLASARFKLSDRQAVLVNRSKYKLQDNFATLINLTLG